MTSLNGNIVDVTTVVTSMYDVRDDNVNRNGGDTIVTGVADVITGRY